MKKAIKIILLIVVLLLVLVCALCIWQWDNISALRMSMQFSQDNLSAMIDENDQKVTDISQKVDGVTVRDLTDEEKEALRNSEISREELIDRLTSTAAEDESSVLNGDRQNESASDSQGNSAAAENTDPNKKQLATYIAEIYLMKAEYTALLEDMYNSAIADYMALDEADRTAAAKYKIGMQCMREALAKEDECDAKMAELEDKIEALLTEMGEDTSIVNDIQAAYEEEKALKKAYYLGLHS